MDNLSASQSLCQPPLLLPLTSTPTDDSISRNTFRRLPLEVQSQYAMHYNLLNANALDSEIICAILCTKNKWIPALDIPGHLQYPTSNGLVIYKDVMDLVDFLATERSDQGESPAGLPNSLRGVSGDSLPLLSHEEQVEESEIVPLSSDRLYNTAKALEWTLKHLRRGTLKSQNCVRETAADVFDIQAKLARETSYHVRVVGLMADAVQQMSAHRDPIRVDGSSTEPHLPIPPTLPSTGNNLADKSRLSNAYVLPIQVDDVRPRLKRQRDNHDHSRETVPDGLYTGGGPYDQTYIVNLNKRRMLWRDDSDGISPEEAALPVDKTLWWSSLSGNVYPSDRESLSTDISYSLSSIAEQDLTGDDLLEYSDDASDSTLQEPVSPLTPSERKLPIPQQLVLESKKRSLKRNRLGTALQFPVYPMGEAVEHGSLSESGLSTDNSEDDHLDMTTLLRAWPPAWSESLGHYRGDPRYLSLGDDGHSYKPGYRDQHARKITLYKLERQPAWRRSMKKLQNDPCWLNCDVGAQIGSMFLSDRHVYMFDDQEWKFFE